MRGVDVRRTAGRLAGRAGDGHQDRRGLGTPGPSVGGRPAVRRGGADRAGLRQPGYAHAASLYQAFTPAEALRIARKLELVHTPKHGSWLNVAEPELSVLSRQCLGQRIACRDEVERQSEAWDERRNARQVGIEWQFTTEDARIKLRHLYPKIKE